MVLGPPSLRAWGQLPAMAKPSFWRQLLDAAAAPGSEGIRADVTGFMKNLVDVLVSASRRGFGVWEAASD